MLQAYQVRGKVAVQCAVLCGVDVRAADGLAHLATNLGADGVLHVVAAVRGCSVVLTNR